MSRVNTQTITTSAFHPSGTATGSNTSVSTSSYPVSNAYNGTSNTSNYARIQLSGSSTSTDCYYYFTFNITGIPSNATITSVSCSARCYVNNRVTTSGTYAAAIQLYNGTTAKGSAQTGIGTSSAIVTISNTGSWTVSELSNLRLRLYGRRSATNQNSYFYLYGADVTITYTIPVTEYQTTITNNSSVTVSPSGSNNYTEEGEDQVITFSNVSDIATLSVVDNNTNVTSQLVNTGTRTYTYTISDISADHTIVVSTVTAYNITASSDVPDLATVDPSSGRAGQGSSFSINITTDNRAAIRVYDNNTDVTSQLVDGVVPSDTVTTSSYDISEYISGTLSVTTASYPVSNGIGGVSSTTQARFYNTSSNTLQNAIYAFNIDIPAGSIIDSVSCQVKGYASSTSIQTRTVQLYAGNVAKGSPSTFATSSSGQTLTLNCGEWTSEEIQNCRLVIQGQSSSASTSYYIRFYGATITVSYRELVTSYNNCVYTINNIQAAHTVVVREAPYFEITGTSSLSGVSFTNLPKHIYASGSNFTAVISGITNPYSFKLSDNNNDVTSSVTFGDTVTCIPSQYLSGPSNPTNPNNVLADTSSTSYAQFTINSSNQEWFYKIDTSGIPENAIIKSVVCKVKAMNNRNTSTAYIDFYSGNTRKTSQANTSTTATTYTLTNLSDWTAEELQDVRLRINDAYTGSTTSYYIGVYGAELIVEYEGGFYTIQNITADHNLVISEAPKYAVSGTSNFTGKSITGTGNVYHGDSITVTLTGLTNTKSFKLYDNNVDVTSSVNTSNWTYSLTNVTVAHTLRLEEATKYAVTGTSNLSGAGFSGLGDVYQGDNITITLTGISNTYSYHLYDNDVDVTSSVNTSNWRYTISNAQAAHALRIEESPYYSITGVSNFDGVTITGTSNKKYQGESITVSLSGITDSASYTLYDNDVDKTSSVNSSYQYTISNIQANHTIRVEENNYVTISGSSTFTGVSFSNLPKKIYQPNYGTSFTVTISGASSSNSFILTDNDRDVTNFVDNYQYVVQNINEDHTLTIEEAQYYSVTGSSSLSGVSISGTSNKVYAGDSITVTITGVSNIYAVKLTDNEVDKSVDIEYVSNSYRYTISNISANHTLTISQQDTVTITTSSSYTGATLSSSVNSIYKGESAVLTLTGVDIDLVSVRVNNNRMITGLFEETGTNEYTCTLEDIRENLTIVVIQKVTYTITCTDNTSYGNITPTGTQTVDGGFDTEYIIESDYFDRIYLKDNNVIVNDEIQHRQGTSSSDDINLGAYTLVSGSFNGSGATYFQGIVGNGVNATQTTSNYYSTNSSTIAVFTYDLVFSDIPEDAVITNLYCQVNGHAESTSNTNEYMCAMLMIGDSSISDELNFKTIGTSNSTQTITATTLPTVSQLSSLKLRCRLGYYGGAINGATCYIEYVTPDYYTYTVQNISAVHTLVLSDRPTYQLTSSSTVQGQTASITPASVTVYENNPATFIISATDISSIRLVDNNAEVTENIIYESGQYKYIIDSVMAVHTIVLEDLLIAYLKLSGAWVKYSKIYKKISGVWVQQATNENILDATAVYVYNS